MKIPKLLILFTCILVIEQSLKAQQPWLLNGTSIYYNNGNVGVGTNSPQTKLHISGKTLIETNDDDVLTFNNTDNSWQYMQFKRSGVRHVWMGLNETSMVVIKLVNNLGSEIMRKNVRAAAGNNAIELEGTSKLAAGVYIMEVIVNSNERMTIKLMKN